MIQKNLVEFLGLSTDQFPSLRIIKMNHHHFFGQKYKMPEQSFYFADLRGFFNNMIQKKIRVYSKSQNYQIVKMLNNRHFKKIDNFKKMFIIHKNNFSQKIKNDQERYGYFMFVHSETELCPRCEEFEGDVIEQFNRVNYVHLNKFNELLI